MKYLKVVGKKEEATLVIDETETPKPNENEVLIKTSAIGVNRADLLQKKGLYPAPKGVSEILGLEASGEIVECGKGVDSSLAGKRVATLLAGGAYAEYVIANKELLFLLNENISDVQGAAISEAYLVAYLNLYLEGNLKENELVYINAGASGIGIAAIQLLKITNNKIIASAGSNKKINYLNNLGADLSINYKEENIKEKIEEKFGKRPVNLILDMVGASDFGDNLSLLSTDGRLVLIGYQSGRRAEIDFGKILLKRLTVKGSTLRHRELDFKINLIKNFKEKFWNKFLTSQIVPVIDKTFSFENANDAHSYMESNANIGKIVIKL